MSCEIIISSYVNCKYFTNCIIYVNRHYYYRYDANKIKIINFDILFATW